MLALTLPKRLANLCSAIRATLGQRQIRQRPGLALNAHSGNDWGPIPVLTGYGRPHRKLKLESTDVILSSSHAKKLASFYQNFVIGQKKVEFFLRYKLVI